MAFEELYQSILLDHYQHPRNSGELSNPTCSLHGHNPLCGDELTIQLTITDETISEIGFHGKGCAISIASASMLTDQIKGKKLPEAMQDIDHFLAIMRDEDEFDNHPEFEEISALDGVKKLHARIKCATLSWNTAKRILEGDTSE